MIEIKVETTETANRISFEGDLTIEHAEEVRRVFAEMPEGGKEIRLHLEKVAAVDVSILQLICSAHRTDDPGRRPLSLEGEPSEAFMHAAGKAGFVKYGCGFGKDNTPCLWAGETAE